MEILIAIELIAGTVFVIGFWFKNPELQVSRRLSRQLLDSYDDKENDDAKVHPSIVATQSFGFKGVFELKAPPP